MGVCNCSMFCCTLLYIHSSIAIILMGKRELIALLNLSSWCLVMVERLFLAMPRGCLQFVIVVFPDHTHLLFLQLVTYLTTDTCLTADPGVESLIPAQSHTFVEIDHEKNIRLFPFLLLIQEGLLSVTSKIICTKYWLTAESKSEYDQEIPQSHTTDQPMTP